MHVKKTALVCGADGFIGHHLVRRLRSEGLWVRGVDLEQGRYGKAEPDDFVRGDLREQVLCRRVFDRSFDEVYQLAADMGGAGYIFTGDNDADVMSNSALINLNVLREAKEAGAGRLFYSSSACVYPARNQADPLRPECSEDSVYPAEPDSDYGWEKLFSERLFLAYARNHGLQVRIARYHNIFGPECSWNDGREKVPAALCRKVAVAREGESVEVWGDGAQTRSFLYIDDCLEATTRLMRSGHSGPVNIGSAEMVSVNELARRVISVSGKDLSLRNVPGPEGVRGRCSDNRMIREILGWSPLCSLGDGLKHTYRWIDAQAQGGAGR